MKTKIFRVRVVNVNYISPGISSIPHNRNVNSSSCSRCCLPASSLFVQFDFSSNREPGMLAQVLSSVINSTI